MVFEPFLGCEENEMVFAILVSFYIRLCCLNSQIKYVDKLRLIATENVVIFFPE
jgi:hypothetical protein